MDKLAKLLPTTLVSVHPFILLLASPFFRRGIEGVVNQQIKPPQSPFEKGGSKEKAIYGWTLIKRSNLIKTIKYVEKLPLLGTGKTDYQTAKEIAMNK